MLCWGRIFLTNPQPNDTGVIGENVDSHVDEGAVYETDDRSAGCGFGGHGLLGVLEVAVLGAEDGGLWS